MVEMIYVMLNIILKFLILFCSFQGLETEFGSIPPNRKEEVTSSRPISPLRGETAGVEVVEEEAVETAEGDETM